MESGKLIPELFRLVLDVFFTGLAISQITPLPFIFPSLASLPMKRYQWRVRVNV